VAPRDRSKYRARGGHSHPHPGGSFVPASVETHGRLGRPIMQFLLTLSDIVSARSLGVTKARLLAGAHRELRMALVHSQGKFYLLLLAEASAWEESPGANASFLDCALCCMEPACWPVPYMLGGSPTLHRRSTEIPHLQTK
jgi:hypothetical protein